jgi:small subunit ribosomal protein S4
MARYTEAVCKLCRREGMKLFLKGDRCVTDKCAVERRPFPPGMQGRRRMKHSEYSHQLREKQKARRTYGVLEKQFRGYYAEASRRKGITGENLLVLLETRLDNVVYRFGFANSRSEARQLVRHGHFLIGDRRVDIPSAAVKVDQVVSVTKKSRKIPAIIAALQSATRPQVPAWLEVDADNFSGRMIAMPRRADIDTSVHEQLIVELYSK